MLSALNIVIAASYSAKDSSTKALPEETLPLTAPVINSLVSPPQAPLRSEVSKSGSSSIPASQTEISDASKEDQILRELNENHASVLGRWEYVHQGQRESCIYESTTALAWKNLFNWRIFTRKNRSKIMVPEIIVVNGAS